MFADNVYNPNGVNVESLPVLYGVHTANVAGDVVGDVITSDGQAITRHISSNKYHLLHDLGMTKSGLSSTYAKMFSEVYPEGYRTEFVEFEAVLTHPVVGKFFKKPERVEETVDDAGLSPPRIVCAANRYGDTIVPSARHHDALMNSLIKELGFNISPGRWEQGFIDQHRKFYTREEAWVIAERNGQIIREVSSPGVLYSENLY